MTYDDDVSATHDDDDKIYILWPRMQGIYISHVCTS